MTFTTSTGITGTRYRYNLLLYKLQLLVRSPSQNGTYGEISKTMKLLQNLPRT
jgi:hypothetical protein